MTNNTDPGAVVVGVDDSPQAAAAAEWAAVEAERRGCALELVHAVDIGVAAPQSDNPPDVIEEVLAEASTMLDDAVARIAAEHPGLRVGSVLVRGAAAEVITHAAGDAAVVVVGTRGRGGFAGLLLGSVSLKVAAHAPCPVVVVRGRAEGMPSGDVVVGVRDERDADVVRFALAEAERRRASVRMVHAWSPLTGMGLVVSQADHIAQQEREHVELVNRVTAPVADYPHVHVDTELVIGSGAATLVDASAKAGLLVVPRHRPTGRVGLRLGSVVHQVLHHAQCPVAVVPAG
ncbi:universal stress protein [Streptomyces sp. NPDC059373]